MSEWTSRRLSVHPFVAVSLVELEGFKLEYKFLIGSLTKGNKANKNDGGVY